MANSPSKMNEQRPSIFPPRGQTQELPSYTCCMCGKRERGWGNNPYPIKENGRCCDECNRRVIVERIKNWDRFER